jgi:hypothetical protein
VRADRQSASGRLHPIGVEDELAGSSGEDDAGDGRRTWAHGDGEAVNAEPGGEAIGVTVEPQRCDLYDADPMGCGGAPWKLGPRVPTR